jgi:hypothetical protein
VQTACDYLLLSGLYRRLRNHTGSCPRGLVGCTTDRELVVRFMHPLTLPRRFNYLI